MENLEQKANEHTKTDLGENDRQRFIRYKPQHSGMGYAEFGGSAAGACVWAGNRGYDRCHPLSE
jgi:hypothetical protein